MSPSETSSAPRYNFEWADIGDLTQGRPNLGDETSVAVYRLMQYTFRETLCREFGQEKSVEIFIQAGKLAGKAFCQNLLDTSLPLENFLSALEKILISLKIGILRFEKTDLTKMEFILTLDEDLDCSGLPIFNDTICDYDEGFIAGIFEGYTGQPFSATEIDCWATGGRTCRFKVAPQ